MHIKGFRKETVRILEKNLLLENPNVEKIAEKTGLTKKQVKNWMDKRKYRNKPDETITDETKKRHLPFETREFLEATFKRNPRPSAGDFSDYSKIRKNQEMVFK